MTPERLKHVIEQCFRKRRREDRELFYDEIAQFLGVKPITLRRWLKGERPVPRQVEIIMEILHFWKDVITAEAVDKLILARDEGVMF